MTFASVSNSNQAKRYSNDNWRDENPLGFADGPNKYRYAGNDPINFRDPSGLSAAGNPLDTLRNAFTRTAAAALRTFNPLLSATIDVGIGLGAGLINSQPRGLRGPNATAAPKPPAPEPPRLIRQLVPGVPIVPQPVENLTGVRAALDNPQRFVMANHQGQGNFVVDLKDGGIRFVTDENILPIDTRLFRAQEAKRNAQTQAQALTLVQEGLITISPVHETTRDLGIAYLGTDFFEPNRKISGDERRAAFVFSLLPGGNSRQVSYADEVLEGFQQVRLFDLPVFQRGKLAEFEPRLLPSGRGGLPFNAETIDAPPGIGVTTIDLSKKSFQTERGLVNRVNSKAARLIPLPADNKQLRIGVPDDVPMTKEQSEAFEMLRRILGGQGVELEVIPIN